MAFQLQGRLGDNRRPSYSQEESGEPQGLHSSCISMDLQDGQRSVGAESSLKLHRYPVKMKMLLLMLV